MFVFSDGHSCVQEIVDKYTSWTWSVLSTYSEFSYSHPRAVGSTWSRPEEGYVKLNADGVVLSSRAHASVGGIIRDTNGVWQCGFSMTIGDGTIFQVEVRATLERLRLAWNKGF
ncbi:hypothetical protein Goari_014506 [Gossypium aridum]|uniref:RNase H type-1 domain-containing protein n=1 Tax=Gossypium aridum TaxID=34290 RepID=A0A7J8XJL9_GOSAI|nr:hypothetical protein [Gossypium aridum]